MAIYKDIFPTKFPLFDFFFQIYKLRVRTALLIHSIDSMSYEYVCLMAYWGSKQLFTFRLYDTYRRQEDRLTKYLKGENMAVRDLENIITIAKQEIDKIEQQK